MKSKLIRISPFIILCIIMAYTWINFLATDYISTLRHQVALAFMGINLALYFVNNKYAIVCTGLILLLATFNLLAFFPVITSYSYSISFGSKEFYAPAIQPGSLLLFIFYLIINARYVYRLLPSENQVNKK